jgi:hypothetical protein
MRYKIKLATGQECGLLDTYDSFGFPSTGMGISQQQLQPAGANEVLLRFGSNSLQNATAKNFRDRQRSISIWHVGVGDTDEVVDVDCPAAATTNSDSIRAISILIFVIDCRLD